MSAVLYDLPGPRAKVRNAGFGLLGIVLVTGVFGFVLYRLYAAGQFDGQLWEWIQFVAIQQALLDALLATLKAFALGAVLALAFGAVFAAGRLSDKAWLRGPALAVVEFFRAVPLLVLIFVFFFGLPSAGITVSAYVALVLGLTLYNGSVLAEVFRAGVLALPRGQREAAYALGLRKTQVMATVLLPQALRSMLPTIVSQLVVLLKDTALGFLIFYPELLFEAGLLGGNGDLHRPILPVAFVVAAIYITLCLLLSGLARYLEARSRRSKKGPGAAAAGKDLVLTADAGGGFAG